MKDSTKKLIKAILALIVLSAGIVAAIYFGLWVMLIKSILTAGVAFDAGLLTGSLLAWTIIKCLFAGSVAWIILSVASWIANILKK